MTTTNPKTLPLPPGNFGLPVIGETISFFRDANFTDKRYKKYGSIFKTSIFFSPTVIMVGSEANLFLFTNDNKYFSNKWPPSTKILLGSASLAIQNGGEHQNRRRILSQAFQPRALAEYASTMEEILQSYLHKWEKMGTLTWYPEIRKYTFDVACKLFVGTDAANNSNFVKLFEQWVGGLFSIPLSLPWTSFGKALRSRKLLLKQIEEIILQRQQQPASNNDALGMLLQATDDDGNKLGVEEIKDQILTLLFAGHETLTSAIASMCLLLAQHPEVLAKVREEQQQLGFSQLTTENLKQMTYLDQVIKEVLRLVPPVGGGFREVIQPCEFNGYLIPQGWSVLYQVPKTHQDNSVYTEPSEFDPERFAPSRAEDKSKPFSHIPFGGGMRECIGKEFAKLEMKLFAALLVRGYEWELLPGQDLSIIPAPTPYPKDKLKVKFVRLNS
ncbi:cytochrome P450 [Rivularia sp. UHCC 0363]|uniref:cytochrome P450 n=1 Tax=Rivularia sp. UHCC 0363 TaxID=3110244 RepID=UPI002B202011|nr:cytochrome P450 [Rivularia sp. UHCC 0363]MEA5593729.1 cytochrome P450 [Rivularia sp. UHCC 0363]